MKYLSIVASIIACVTTGHSAALAQGGPIQPCTFTATHCLPLSSVETILVDEVPFPVTVTQTFDCQGCADVTVTTKDCFGHGPVVTSTTFVLEIQPTITTAICSATPN